MATIPNARASYQRTDNISLVKRESYASQHQRQTLYLIEMEAIKARNATTQAAYQLRLNTLRSLIKGL